MADVIKDGTAEDKVVVAHLDLGCTGCTNLVGFSPCDLGRGRGLG